MIKNIWRFGIFSALLLLLIIPMTPVMAQDSGYVSLQAPFTVDPNQSGTNIAIGSTIYHLANGETDVYNPAGVISYKVLDSGTQTAAVPQGQEEPVSHIIEIPSGCGVSGNGAVTKIFQGNQCILTIVNNEQSNNTISGSIPDSNTNAYLEYAYDGSKFSSISSFVAYWECPNPPANNTGNNYYYLWNGLWNLPGTGLLQPVLEWNYKSTHAYTGAAWYVVNSNDWLRATPVNVTPLIDLCEGNMYWTQANGGYWIQFKDVRTSLTSNILVLGYSSSLLDPYVCLEIYNCNYNSDVPPGVNP